MLDSKRVPWGFGIADKAKRYERIVVVPATRNGTSLGSEYLQVYRQLKQGTVGLRFFGPGGAARAKLLAPSSPARRISSPRRSFALYSLAAPTPMRRTFFSFHYKRDVWRAKQVRNSWVTKMDRDSRGFFDSSVFESKQRTSDEALKRFLRDGLKNCGVTCVLAGNQTAFRRWVRYELVRSFRVGKGILCVKIHRQKNSQGLTDTAGPNPFNHLAFRVDGGRLRFLEKRNGKWIDYVDAPGMALSDVKYALGAKDNHTFATLFRTYDYKVDDGYTNLGTWIEAAARQAGR